MRAAILVISAVLALPAYAQSDNQDHTSHHPAAGDAAATSAPTPKTAEDPIGAAATSGMSCPMMPAMMQSMMRGMMQGMMGAQGRPPSAMGMDGMSMGAMGPGGMGSGSMGPGGMGTGGMGRQGMGGMGGGRSAPMSSGMALPDQSLAVITLRAVAARAGAAMARTSPSEDVEFARIAVAAQEALVDAARSAAAFSANPDVRRKAQDIVRVQEAELASLRAWAATLK